MIGGASWKLAPNANGATTSSEKRAIAIIFATLIFHPL
jgi:hypothetical protein